MAFSLSRGEEALAQISASIGPAPDEATIAPFLGTYSNPALGEITLSWDGERLILDGGEIVGEIRTATGEIARAGDFVLTEGPFLGMPLNLNQTDAGPRVEFADPSQTTQYVFTPIGEFASPVATPMASPMASPLATPVP